MSAQLIAQLSAALQGANQAIEALAARVTELERRLDDLEPEQAPVKQGQGRPPKQAAAHGTDGI